MNQLTIEIINDEHDLIVRKTVMVDDLHGSEARDFFIEMTGAAHSLIPKEPPAKPHAAPAPLDTADGSF